MPSYINRNLDGSKIKRSGENFNNMMELKKQPNQKERRDSQLRSNFYFHLKYKCRQCASCSKKSLHPSNFKQTCQKCNFNSHLVKLSSSYRLIYGRYRCQDRKCNSEWMQKLPFRSIIKNTPVCKKCNQLTRVSLVMYKRLRISFKNSVLFKCEKCSKCIAVSNQEEGNNLKAGYERTRKGEPECRECGIIMNFYKRIKNLFSSLFKQRKNILQNPPSLNQGPISNYDSNSPRDASLKMKDSVPYKKENSNSNTLRERKEHLHKKDFQNKNQSQRKRKFFYWKKNNKKNKASLNPDTHYLSQPEKDNKENSPGPITDDAKLNVKN